MNRFEIPINRLFLLINKSIKIKLSLNYRILLEKHCVLLYSIFIRVRLSITHFF